MARRPHACDDFAKGYKNCELYPDVLWSIRARKATQACIALLQLAKSLYALISDYAESPKTLMLSTSCLVLVRTVYSAKTRAWTS